MKIVYVWGLPVLNSSLLDIPFSSKKNILINTISPNSYGISVRNPEAKEALQKSDILILDGLYFGWASIVQKGIHINRITGWDALIFFSKEMEKNEGRVFFLGSTKETLGKIKRRYQYEFPHLEVGSYSPPFKDKFSEEDNHQMQEAINAFQPNVLFVGMTAPKQEIWSYQNRPYLKVNVICTIGNAFDWYAGNSKRPGVFWQKVGLEWLVRIFYRREIFRRNIGNQMLFFWHLLLFTLHLKKIE